MFFITEKISFLWHNSVTFILLFCALKKELDLKKKIIIAVALSVLLFMSFTSYTSYNLTALFIVYGVITHNKIKQSIMIMLALMSFFYCDIRVLFFQKLSGEKIFTPLSEQNPTSFITPHLSNEQIETTKGDFKVIFTPIMDAEINARIVYIDEYDKKFSPDDYYSHPLYDALAPLDVTIFVNSMADNWQKFKIKHEQRYVWVYTNNAVLYKSNEWSNIHIIPKNKTIRNGFKTIRRGDIVKIKGFLVDWQGSGIYDYFKIQTAKNFAEYSEQKLGGQKTLLCMQLFVTELFANGYIFK